MKINRMLLLLSLFLLISCGDQTIDQRMASAMFFKPKNDTTSKNIYITIPQNKPFVDDLVNAFETDTLPSDFIKYFNDKIGVYSMSMEKSSTTESVNIIDYLKKVLLTTEVHNFKLFFKSDNAIDAAYILEYEYYIEIDGELKTAMTKLIFIERYGKIFEFYGP